MRTVTAVAAAAVVAAASAAAQQRLASLTGCRVGADGVFSVTVNADCDTVEISEEALRCRVPDAPVLQMMRMTTCAYADGVGEPFGEGLPSARAVSNAVAAQGDEVMVNQLGHSDWIWQWGQFIDHDFVLSGSSGEPMPIAVPTGDPWFDPNSEGGKTMRFTRTAFDTTEELREQTNLITPELDASMVYGGNDEARVARLRAFSGGRLLVSDGNLLPLLRDGDHVAPGEEGGLFIAGDVRANEQSALTATHTLLVREHNRLADEYAAANPGASDNELYWMARRAVSSIMHAITYEEWLPLVLGAGSIPPYAGHNPAVDVAVANEFASAAFRFGHTSLSSTLLRLAPDGGPSPDGPLPLRAAFFDSAAIMEHNITPLLLGLGHQLAQRVDTRFVDDVRNFLFGPPGSGGFDLFALNVQRGRDHGMPRYNEVRRQLGLGAKVSFLDMTGGDAELADAFASVYDSVDDVDMYPGGLAEPAHGGGMLGELFNYIVRDQFVRSRDGDPNFYLNSDFGRQFAGTRLSDVILRNTDAAPAAVQENVFLVP